MCGTKCVGKTCAFRRETKCVGKTHAFRRETPKTPDSVRFDKTLSGVITTKITDVLGQYRRCRSEVGALRLRPWSFLSISNKRTMILFRYTRISLILVTTEKKYICHIYERRRSSRSNEPNNAKNLFLLELPSPSSLLYPGYSSTVVVHLFLLPCRLLTVGRALPDGRRLGSPVVVRPRICA